MVAAVARQSVCGLLALLRMAALAAAGAVAVVWATPLLAAVYGVAVGWLVVSVPPSRRALVCVATIAGVLGAAIGRIAGT